MKSITKASDKLRSTDVEHLIWLRQTEAEEEELEVFFSFMDQSQSPRNFSHRSTPVPAIETNGSRASSARNSLAGSRPGA